MNTFWLKIAAFALVVMIAIVLIGVFSPSEKSQPATEPTDKPETKQKTFYDQVAEDKRKFSAKPQLLEEQTPQPSTEPITLYFRPLSEIDKIEAERLLNVAVPGRSIGRLPMASGAGAKLMVDCCRQIISKWPDSWYAYNAKRMLIDMPERFRQRYNITQQELDISEFTKQRPGTKPFSNTIEKDSP